MHNPRIANAPPRSSSVAGSGTVLITLAWNVGADGSFIPSPSSCVSRYGSPSSSSTDVNNDSIVAIFAAVVHWSVGSKVRNHPVRSAGGTSPKPSRAETSCTSTVPPLSAAAGFAPQSHAARTPGSRITFKRVRIVFRNLFGMAYGRRGHRRMTAWHEFQVSGSTNTLAQRGSGGRFQIA